MTQKRSLLRAAVVLLAVLLLSVFASAAAETAEAPQQTVFVFDQDREMDLSLAAGQDAAGLLYSRGRAGLLLYHL